MHVHADPQIYFPRLEGRESEGEQKQCGEADVITKGNTSCVSASLSDPHGGSKSELIRVPQNGGIFHRGGKCSLLFSDVTLGR